MAFIITTPRAGVQQITDLSTTKTVPLGTIVQATDPTLGTGEFIYLDGVSSTIVGSIVRYDDSFQSALASTAVDVSEPCAIAMAICTASYYGWYQISGLAVAKKASATTFADGAGMGAASGLAIAIVTNVQMNGIVCRSVTTTTGAAANYVSVTISRPTGPGNAVAA
jgi:hypothetical protein